MELGYLGRSLTLYTGLDRMKGGVKGEGQTAGERFLGGKVIMDKEREVNEQ